MKNQVSTGIYLDTRRPRKDGTCAVKLRVTFQRKTKFYVTKISVTPQDFEKINGERPRQALKKIKIEFAEIEKKAMKVIDKIQPFSFEEFEARFFNKVKNGEGVIGLFALRIAELESENSFGTAIVYRNAMESLNRFAGGDEDKRMNIKFSEITVNYLRRYENWMAEQGNPKTGKGNSKTTIGIYMRQIRAIFNLAIKKNFIEREYYPFGKDLYNIPSGRKGKTALTLAEIKKLVTYPAQKGSYEEFARDMWYFSYLCNGANMKDLAQLKWKDINGEHINFIRAKTEKKSLKEISVYILPQMWEILERHGQIEINGDSLVFPIVPANIDAKTARKKRMEAIKQINKHVRAIADEVGIEKKCSTMVARHSFTNVMVQNGVSLVYISQALGHSTVITTQNYVNQLPAKEREVNAHALVAF